MTRRRIVSNLLLMGAGQLSTWALSAVYLVMISHYLGPRRLGELTLAGSLVAMLMLVVRLGMDTLIARTVARAPERTGSLASAAILVRAVLAVPMLVALYAYAQVAHLNDETRAAAYILAVWNIIESLSGVLGVTFQGREQMRFPVIGLLMRGVIEVVVAAITIWLHGSLVFFVAVNVPFELLILVLSLRWFRQIGRLTWRIPLADLRYVVTGSLPFWASTVFLNIYVYIDSVVLAGLVGTQAVGFYTPATRMFGVAFFLSSIVGSVTLPLLSRLGVEAGEDFRRAGRKTLSLLITAAVPLTIGLITFAGPLITLIYGPSYTPAVPVLAVLSLCILPTYLNIQANQFLVATDRQWRWTIVMAASCVANPLVNLVLIPFADVRWHNGALGAALALLVTELAMAIYSVIVLSDMLLDRDLLRAIVGTAGAGAAQAITFWLCAGLGSVPAETLGLAAFVIGAVAFGALPRDEVELLWDLAQWRRRRAFGRRLAAIGAAIDAPPRYLALRGSGLAERYSRPLLRPVSRAWIDRR